MAPLTIQCEYSQNDAKAKLKKAYRDNVDLQRSSNQLEFARRVLETRARTTLTAASPATPAGFSFVASGRSAKTKQKMSWLRLGLVRLSL